MRGHVVTVTWRAKDTEDFHVWCGFVEEPQALRQVLSAGLRNVMPVRHALSVLLLAGVIRFTCAIHAHLLGEKHAGGFHELEATDNARKYATAASR
jgi:hypothetical protein